MRPIVRYSLIAAGIIAFVILTPLTILFISGTKYDFTTGKFVKTGILSIKSDPDGAMVLLNGKNSGNTNETIRFLNPGDYKVALRKDGYFDWIKTLTVKAQYSTNGAANNQSIYLFKSGLDRQTVASGVVNFFAGSKRLLYITNTAIFIAGTGNPQNPSQIQLPRSYAGFSVMASADENYFLVYNNDFYGLVDAVANKLVDITKIIKSQLKTAGNAAFSASPDEYKFSDDDQLYQLQNGSLYVIEPAKQSKTFLMDGIMTFYPAKGAIYFIKLDVQGGVLQRTLAMASGPLYQPTSIIDNLPPFHTASIYFSATNQMFVVGNSTLYSVDQNLRPISNYIDQVRLLDGGVYYSTGNEVDRYDINSAQSGLITRSASAIYQMQPTSTGWTFFISDGKIRNIESDLRDSQNSYSFGSVTNLAKFTVSENGNTLWILDNGALSEMQIR